MECCQLAKLGVWHTLVDLMQLQGCVDNEEGGKIDSSYREFGNFQFN